MPLYKYVTAETAIRILNGSIRLTQPGAFNDPFELLPQFIVRDSVHGGNYSLQVGCVGSRRKGIARNHIVEEDRYKGDFQARQFRRSLDEAVGILCLSRNPESLLMWGHYADEYRGAIIEFDESHSFFEGLIPVSYKKTRPIYDVADFIHQPFPIADLCIKPNVWSYEREERIARPLAECKRVGEDKNKNAVMVMPVPLNCVRGVVMGERMTVENQRAIWELVKDTELSLQLAAVSNWEYQFRHEAIKYRGPLQGAPIISARTAHIFTDAPGQFGDIARWMVNNHHSSEFVNLPC